MTPESGSCDPLCSLDETSSQEFEESYQPKTDSLKAVAILGAAATGAVAINHSWVATNQVHQCPLLVYPNFYAAHFTMKYTLFGKMFLNMHIVIVIRFL